MIGKTLKLNGFLVCLISLFPVAVCSQSVEPLQSINSKIAAIIDPQARPPEVQVATLPGVVEWNNNGGKYQFYQLCDSLPAWGSSVASTGISLSGRYSQFLLGIVAAQGDPLADVEQRRIAIEASEKWKEYEKAKRALIDEWLKTVAKEQSLPEANRTAYSSFMRGAGIDLASREISYSQSLSRWQPFAARAMLSSVGRALNDLMSTAYQVKVKTYGGAEFNVLSCEPGIDLVQRLETAKANYATTPPDVVLHFSRRNGERRENWESWGGSVGWGPFSVSARGTRHEVKINDNNFQMTLELPTVLRFSVQRPWLNLSLIQTYGAPTVIEGSELARLMPLWGERGSFSLIPLEFIVAYRPRATVKMASSDYSIVKSTFEGGGSFSIGPITVGGGGGSGSIVEKWDDQASTVVVGTNADTFVLLGVRNRILP